VTNSPRPSAASNAGSPGPLVDYERAARRYEGGRALGDDVLDRWRAAVEGLGPAVPSPAGARVLDLGAGTGLFSRAWLSWGASSVVAVEPSAGMRAEAAGRDPAGVAHVAGRAEAIPLKRGAVDVAWLSTVLHHLTDVAAAVAELARALRPGGAVLVRNFMPDRGRATILDHMPPAAAARARARMPAATAIAAAFAAGGFRPAGGADVTETLRFTGTQGADWVERMRHADTLLGALTPDEVEATKASLAAQGDTLLPPGVVSLLAFATP
jgi:ubiquinone/menaquinone biosynthesis C-methylase UbiE